MKIAPSKIGPCTKVSPCFTATEGAEERRQQNQRGESVSSAGLCGGWPSTPMAGDASHGRAPGPAGQSGGCVGTWCICSNSKHSAFVAYGFQTVLLTSGPDPPSLPGWGMAGSAGACAAHVEQGRPGPTGLQEQLRVQRGRCRDWNWRPVSASALRKPRCPCPHSPRAATCRGLFRATSWRIVSVLHSAVSCARGRQHTGLVWNVSSLVPAQRASFLAATSTVGSRGRP